jgi:hypothetical protein
MRWKWRLGLLSTAAVEIPLLLWVTEVFGAPPEIVLYAGGILAVVLLAMLALRPFLFAILTGWLGGVVASSWYFLRYLPPGFALGLGATLSSIAAAVGFPVASRTLGFVLRRGSLLRR